jgi:hypothetical protein
MQNDIHSLARLIDGHHIAPRLEHTPMGALRNPIQLCVSQPCE